MCCALFETGGRANGRYLIVEPIVEVAEFSKELAQWAHHLDKSKLGACAAGAAITEIEKVAGATVVVGLGGAVEAVVRIGQDSSGISLSWSFVFLLASGV